MNKVERVVPVQWNSDTNTWVGYSLSGIQVSVPAELVPLQVNQRVWKFPLTRIEWTGGVMAGDSLMLEIVNSQGLIPTERFQQTKSEGERWGAIMEKMGTTPGNWEVWKERSPVGVEGEATPGALNNKIFSSSIGYHLVNANVILSVSIRKRHSVITYAEWKTAPIFTPAEQQLLDAFAASIRLGPDFHLDSIGSPSHPATRGKLKK